MLEAAFAGAAPAMRVGRKGEILVVVGKVKLQEGGGRKGQRARSQKRNVAYDRVDRRRTRFVE